MNFGISNALASLRPGEEWVLRGSEYEDLEWLSSTTKPSKEELDEEIARLEKQWKDTEYQRLRAQEYPNFFDYLDGVVKGDQEQINAYIAKCLAIKEKYPKP